MPKKDGFNVTRMALPAMRRLTMYLNIEPGLWQLRIDPKRLSVPMILMLQYR